MIHRLFGTGNRPSYFSPADARVNGLLDVACQPRGIPDQDYTPLLSLSLSYFKGGTTTLLIVPFFSNRGECRKFMDEGSIHEIYCEEKKGIGFEKCIYI